MEIVTDLDHATHHQAWQRFLNNEGGYLRLVDHSPDGSAITNPSGGQIARITGLRAATAADQQNLLAANSPDPTGKMVIQIGVVYDVGGLAPRTDLPIGNEKNTWHRRPRHVQGSHHTYLVAVEKSLFWRSKHPAFITVYEFLTNTSLKEYNTETTHGNVGAAVVTLNTVKLIKLPCLFFPAASGSQAAAFTPNLVNLHWMGQSAMLPKPYGPRRASGEDVFEAAAIATGPPLSTGSVFVDTWAKFHLLGGEAHCGGADERVPEGGWWQQLPTNN
jgi:hypothetical protein